jgi:hypothetical protein
MNGGFFSRIQKVACPLSGKLDSGSPQPEADLAGMTLGLFNEL